MACKPQYKGKRYNSLEELYKANGVTPQQKQQAQQLYSQYLESLNTTELYSKLGNKTESGNVKVVKNIFANKDNEDVITAFRVNNKLGLLESFKKYNAIGNPINWQDFKPRFEGDNAAIAFMDWFLGRDYTNLEQEYRQEILSNLDNLKGKIIEYYKELGRPSHATALDYLVNHLGSKQDIEQFKSWLDNNQSDVQYQKQIDLQAEQDSVLEEFANSLSERFNISFDLVSEEKAKSISPEYANEPAFFDPKTKKAYLVKGKANKTSAIHEIFTHPFLLQIEKTNPTLYKNLLKEAKNNKSVVDYVDNLYGTNQNNDHEYIARAIDLAVQGELDQQKDKTLLERIQDFFNQLYDYLKKLFNIPEVFSSAISPNITLQQLAQFAMYGKGKMNLNPAQENIEYSLKATNVIVKNLDKIKQWERNKSISKDVLWNKIQGLGVPKEQIELVKNSEGNTVEEKLLDFANQYGYTIEINTAKYQKHKVGDIVLDDMGMEFTVTQELLNNRTVQEGDNTQHYSNLTVPGGTNYTENEIATPLITPSIKGHAEFSTDNGIGWFRSDDANIRFDNTAKNIINNVKDIPVNQFTYNNNTFYKRGETWFEKLPEYVGDQEMTDTGIIKAYNSFLNISGKDFKTRRILEVQSDLFQKGRGKKELITEEYEGVEYVTNNELIKKLDSEVNPMYSSKDSQADPIYIENIAYSFDTKGWYSKKYSDVSKENQFLQLLNKDNNWVTFFIKAIIQDSAKKGYKKVLFPLGDTASKIEGHQTLEEFKKQIEDRIKELEEANDKLLNQEDKFADEIAKTDIDAQIAREEYLSGINTEINQNNKEINQLKQELERIEREGFGALEPIYNFYENIVANILKKQGYNPVVITDEYGNTWNEITIDENRDNQNIVFQKTPQSNSFQQFQQLLNNPNTNPTLQGNQEAVITPNDNQELLYKLNDIFEDRTSLIFNINNNKDFDTNNRLKAIRSLIDNKEVNYNNHLEHLEEYLELFEHLPVIYNLINKYGSKQAILEVYDNDNGSGNNNLQQEFIEAVNGLKSIFRNVNKTKLNSLENWLDENIVDINKIDIQDKDDNVLYPTEQYSLDVNNEKFIKYYYELSGKKEDIITFAKRLKSTIATYKLLGYNNDKILEMLKCL